MKGIYLLHILLRKDICIKVGALGKINFKKGNYIYVGSAQNNLEKRIHRHLSKNKKIHWHIDYFLNNKYTSIKNIFYKKASKKKECLTAKELNGFPIKNFGCSDCKCVSHLFKINDLKFLKNFKIFSF